jgi:hypothetical protein
LLSFASADGLLGALVDEFKQLKAEMVTETNPVLELVARVCADIDCALEFGMRGGHQQLQRLLSQAARLPVPESDEVTHPMELLADAVGACSQALPEGYSFPMSPTLSDAYEHMPAFFSFEAPLLRDPAPADAGKQPAATCIKLVVRQEWSKRMESQADVGQVLWPAAEIMSRWAAETACAAWQQSGYSSLLELGAGMGLTGLLTAHFMPKVVLTDFNTVVLRNLHYNAVLNTAASNLVQGDDAGAGTVHALPSNFPAAHTVLVRRLDWSLDNSRDPPLTNQRAVLQPLPSGLSGERGSRVQSLEWGCNLHPDLDGCPSFDVIIGSDMICCKEDAENVARATAHWLAPCGTAYFMLPPSRVRWGVQCFASAAEQLGLVVVDELVPHHLVEDIIKRPTTHRDTAELKRQGVAATCTSANADNGQAQVATGGGVYEQELRIYTVRWK